MKRCKWCKGSGKSIEVVEIPSFIGSNINKLVSCPKCYGKGSK